ncbi:MAG: hypothetical protein ACRC33_24200 [Gemmataceae bacterium]
MDEQRPWHRLFGLTWADFFRGTPVAVEPEKDLAVQQQRLDVLILRRGPGPIGRAMPAGFEELAAHNLVTFKSLREPMDEWALCELIGHFVAYRKLASPSTSELLPAGDFRLFAVCSRRTRGWRPTGRGTSRSGRRRRVRCCGGSSTFFSGRGRPWRSRCRR